MKYYRVSESVPFMGGGCKFKITDFQSHRARIISDFPASHQGKKYNVYILRACSNLSRGEEFNAPSNNRHCLSTIHLLQPEKLVQTLETHLPLTRLPLFLTAAMKEAQRGEPCGISIRGCWKNLQDLGIGWVIWGRV